MSYYINGFDDGGILSRCSIWWGNGIIGLEYYENYVHFIDRVFPKEEYHHISVMYVLTRNTKGVIILTLLNSQTHIDNEVRMKVGGGPMIGFGVEGPFLAMS